MTNRLELHQRVTVTGTVGSIAGTIIGRTEVGAERYLVDVGYGASAFWCGRESLTPQ